MLSQQPCNSLWYFYACTLLPIYFLKNSTKSGQKLTATVLKSGKTYSGIRFGQFSNLDGTPAESRKVNHMTTYIEMKIVMVKSHITLFSVPQNEWISFWGFSTWINALILNKSWENKRRKHKNEISFTILQWRKSGEGCSTLNIMFLEYGVVWSFGISQMLACTGHY